MKRTNFLNADESALFQCDHYSRNGEYDGQCFIAHGPAKTFMDAFNRAFEGYDYDKCHAVKRLDNEACTIEDITAECRSMIDEDTFARWCNASLIGKDYDPAFMGTIIAEATMGAA